MINGKIPQDKLLNDADFIIWENEWTKRIEKNQNKEKAKEIMIQNNPIFIPRNHKVEESLKQAEQGDLSYFKKLLSILEKPYLEDSKQFEYSKPAPSSDRVYKTYCGT